ncbi:hypothetical protein GCM10027570_02840 [Streptomonospora sediminis]
MTTTGETTGDTTRLSVRDEARLATVAGKLHAAAFAATDDQRFLRALLADALEEVDQVRGRCTRVATARPWPISRPPEVPCARPAPAGDPPEVDQDQDRDQPDFEPPRRISGTRWDPDYDEAVLPPDRMDYGPQT